MSLRFFRKKRNVKIITIIIGVVTIPGFIFYGMSISAGSSNKNYAAIVNGAPITLQNYYSALDRLERRYSQMLGPDYTKKINNSRMERLVINNMIDEKILVQQARKYNIKVSSAEIMKAIESTPLFQNKKGQFSKSKFSEYFSNMSPQHINNIENGLKQQIMYQKLKQFIVSQTNIVVNNADLKQYITKKTSPKEIEQIRKFVLQEKENQLFQKWFSNVKSHSKIRIFIVIKKTAPVKETVPPKKNAGQKKNG
ncbi:MAG: SurA N-terminal domain-containing protein [Candidatus Omnitrophica bacterium]|nr:SurA N-terminal domain-containing protein [Candidatus Omnitrophota bacterium]